MGLDASGFTTLVVEEADDRLHARLHRPEVRNAIDQGMVDELHAVCAHLEANPKVLILSGTPADPAAGAKGVFASGADIAQLRQRRRDDALAGINSGVFERIARLPMPVIAALEGYALGGGAELAYAADFRIGTDSLRLGNPETGLGIMAAAGATWRLRELVGEALAKEVLLAGKVLTGAECLAAGLVTELVEPAELIPAAHVLADRIGAQDPLAVRISKAVFHTPREVHPLIDTLAQGMLFESQAKFDRMQAFLDRKKSK
ncbi:putative enoyl-CoA hydratase/isomerase [Sinomonas cellulolyticus]|uniref:Enoyl-CoA hydratase/isomerase family protein n=1 Tax=Sinomonas cellulolyticus TaxID=2801916 RepID=A0ABS1K2R5_9MICC|nr:MULTISPECIES: enoyl-CoA hydratase/isomerase family protein [Sinomonas]MBL0705753.1 enoyl-CoA hydratase/isomerase family protein [Sinomonas cellulolyticus]GHG52269.1 putative enoyl-CoA hydratase/isomerase [Sinomonas sp. KCTC 49339]